MKAKIRSIFFYALFFINLVAFGGFPAGTLVQTGNILTPIEELTIGDLVTCYDFKAGYAEKPVLATKTHTADDVVILVVNGIEIVTAKYQRFYLPDQKKWQRAVDLKVGDRLWGTQLEKESLVIEQILHSKNSTTKDVVILYDISVQDCHNFLILENGILVHNFVDFFAGISIKVAFDSLFAFSTYEVVQAGAVAAVAGMACAYDCLRSKWHSNSHNYQPDSSGSGSSYGSGSGPSGNHNNNDDDDDKKKKALNKVKNKAKEVANQVVDAAKQEVVSQLVNQVLETAGKAYNEHTLQPPSHVQTNQPQEQDYRYWQDKKAKAASAVANPYPNGVYKGENYHLKEGYNYGYNGGVKSPAPIDGQAALNNSFPIEGMSKQRVGISENQVVIFKETAHGEYHGYVPTWEYICSKSHMSEVRNELMRRKLVNKKGRVLCR